MAHKPTKDEQFTQLLLQRIDEAQEKCGCRQLRLRQEIERLGGAAVAKGLAARGRVSEGFDWLTREGRLALSLEKTALEAPFGELFTDEEADWFLQQLLEVGYYQV